VCESDAKFIHIRPSFCRQSWAACSFAIFLLLQPTPGWYSTLFIITCRHVSASVMIPLESKKGYNCWPYILECRSENCREILLPKNLRFKNPHFGRN